MKTEKQECLDAIEYFFEMGMIDQMRRDEQYYIKVLLNRVSKSLNIHLEWRD